MSKNQDEIAQALIAITTQFQIESGILNKGEIKLDASLQRHLGVDSLGRAELFRRIEKHFDVAMPDSLLANAQTLQDILDFLITSSPHTLRQPISTVVSHEGERAEVNLSKVHTLLDLPLLYAESAPNKPHIYFQREDGQQEIITYSELLKSSLRIAHALLALGLKKGETVAIMQPTHPDFFYSFFGILYAGGIPVPIYPPFRMHMLETYAKVEASILCSAQVRILITFGEAEKLSHVLKPFVPSLKHIVTAKALLQQDMLKDFFHANSNNFAFIQYTSGSTSDPKGVLLSHANLLANIRAYGKAIQIEPDDVTVSWLPLYHDMGLIGMWLGSLYFGIPLVLLTPFSFLNHPEKWLWAIHYHRGTLSGAPNFAYELCVRKIEPALIEGLDLSSWRIAANGAEKIYPRTLVEFVKKFASYGFRRRAILPVYGLAESTVALAIPPLDRDFRLDYVEREMFEENHQAVPILDKANALTFVGCGYPLVDHEIRIVNDKQKVLPARHIGHLQFRGPSNMQGYFNNPSATEAIYHDGWLDSGDLAYLADEEVFITGRSKDLIIKAGRNLYPAEIEELVGNIAGIRLGCVAVFGVMDAKRGTEKLVIVAETREKRTSMQQNLANEIRDIIASNLDIVPDEIILTTPHTVPKTSSGKLQRAACKKMFLKRQLVQQRVPPWMQIIKLGGWSLLQKSKSMLQVMVKFLYTVYVALIVALSLIPFYIYVLFVSRDKAATFCRRWARWLQLASFCPLSLAGQANLNTGSPVIFTANHASYLDPIILLAILPTNTLVIGKKELLTVPIIKTFMKRLNYLSVDRLDLTKGLQDTKHIETALKNGYSVLIFPEGTFGYASGLRPFRLGAFKVAVDAKVPICPIAIQGTRKILRDDEKLMQPGYVKVTIGKLIMAANEEWQEVTRLRDRVRIEIAKNCGEPSLDFIAPQAVAEKIGKHVDKL